MFQFFRQPARCFWSAQKRALSRLEKTRDWMFDFSVTIGPLICGIPFPGKGPCCKCKCVKGMVRAVPQLVFLWFSPRKCTFRGIQRDQMRFHGATEKDQLNLSISTLRFLTFPLE